MGPWLVIFIHYIKQFYKLKVGNLKVIKLSSVYELRYIL